MQEHIWGLKESRKKNRRRLVRLGVRVFQVRQVTLWSRAPLARWEPCRRRAPLATGTGPATVTGARPEEAAHLARCPTRSAKCAPLAQACGPCSLCDFRTSFCASIHSADIYMVFVVCQTHGGYSGYSWRAGQRSHPLEPASCLPSQCLQPLRLPLVFARQPVFHMCYLWGLCDFYTSSHPTSHDSISWPSPATRRKLQRLGVSFGASRCLLQPPLQPFFLLCSHCLLTCVRPALSILKAPHTRHFLSAFPLQVPRQMVTVAPSSNLALPPLPPWDSPRHMVHTAGCQVAGMLSSSSLRP